MHGVYVNSIDKWFIIIIVILSFSVLYLFSDDMSAVLYPDNDVVMNFDRSILSDDITISEPNTCTIHVMILDNLLRYPAHVQMYKNGDFVQSVYMAEGKRSFINLEYGTYKFEVSDPDYNMWWRNVYPEPDGYDNKIGEVTLSQYQNTVSYSIEGDNPKTRMSGLESPPRWYDERSPTGHFLHQKVKLFKGFFNIR